MIRVPGGVAGHRALACLERQRLKGMLARLPGAAGNRAALDSGAHPFLNLVSIEHG